MAIPQPNYISLPYANRQYVVDLQLLKPEVFTKFVKRYGNMSLTWWLATYGGMVPVKNKSFSWYEQKGKDMQGINVAAAVTANVNGATVALTLAVAEHYNAGTQSPLREKQSFRVASTGVEGVIVGPPNKTVANAHTFNARPKRADQNLASAGSTTLLPGDVLVFTGYLDAGEASSGIDPLLPLWINNVNYCTEIRETWAASDWAEMVDIWVGDIDGIGTELPGAKQAGYGYFTKAGLNQTCQTFVNSVDQKLILGDLQTNTGLSNSTGTRGLVPDVLQNGTGLTYTPGSMGFDFAYDVTRLLRLNGSADQAIWITDLYQSRDFSDSIFNALPAGAFVWGQNEKSEEASISYGFKSINIEGYMLQKKIWDGFNTELTTGITPVIDRYKNFGIIMPMGSTNIKNSDGSLGTAKSVDVVYMQPPGGGTVKNGIRVWPHGGGSLNPTDATMVDYIEMITYRGIRTTALNQFIYVQPA